RVWRGGGAGPLPPSIARGGSSQGIVSAVAISDLKSPVVTGFDSAGPCAAADGSSGATAASGAAGRLPSKDSAKASARQLDGGPLADVSCGGGACSSTASAHVGAPLGPSAASTGTEGLSVFGMGSARNLKDFRSGGSSLACSQICFSDLGEDDMPSEARYKVAAQLLHDAFQSNLAERPRDARQGEALPQQDSDAQRRHAQSATNIAGASERAVSPLVRAPPGTSFVRHASSVLVLAPPTAGLTPPFPVAVPSAQRALSAPGIRSSQPSVVPPHSQGVDPTVPGMRWSFSD
ncbi:unnamed protein product, partial [Polarella glacialis]